MATYTSLQDAVYSVRAGAHSCPKCLRCFLNAGELAGHKATVHTGREERDGRAAIHDAQQVAVLDIARSWRDSWDAALAARRPGLRPRSPSLFVSVSPDSPGLPAPAHSPTRAPVSSPARSRGSPRSPMKRPAPGGASVEVALLGRDGPWVAPWPADPRLPVRRFLAGVRDEYSLTGGAVVFDPPPATPDSLLGDVASRSRLRLYAPPGCPPEAWFDECCSRSGHSLQDVRTLLLRGCVEANPGPYPLPPRARKSPERYSDSAEDDRLRSLQAAARHRSRSDGSHAGAPDSAPRDHVPDAAPVPAPAAPPSGPVTFSQAANAARLTPDRSPDRPAVPCPVCAKSFRLSRGTNPRQGLYMHMEEHTRNGVPLPPDFLAADRRFACLRCGAIRSFAHRASHEHECRARPILAVPFGPPPPFVVPPHPGSVAPPAPAGTPPLAQVPPPPGLPLSVPASDSSQAVAPVAVLPAPSLDQVFSARVPVLRSVPPAAAPAVAEALEAALRRLSAAPSTWAAVLSFAKCVLSVPSRGGAGHTASTLRRRCRQFSEGHIGELWAEALAPRPCVGRPPPDPDAVARRQARAGEYQRAMRTLSGAPPLVPSLGTLEALRALNPPGAAPHVPAAPPADDWSFSPPLVVKALRRFRRGSAPGPSGLSAAHLLQLLSVPSGNLASALAGVVSAVANGAVPAAIVPFLFGARAVALPKPAGGVRPIACGEVLRRLAGKLLADATADDAAALLLPTGQVGIGVPGGAEAVARGAQEICTWYTSGDPSVASRVVLQLDFRNAFNLVDRDRVLAAAARHMPRLFRYAAAAYAGEAHLFHGPDMLASQRGTHQGDPLGGLLFSLPLADLMREVLPDDQGIDLRGLYYDDAIVAGDVGAVSAFMDRLVHVGPSYGIHVHPAKCAVRGPGAPLWGGHAEVSRGTLDAWTVVGVPVGTPAWVSSEADRAARLALDVAAHIPRLADPHVAFATHTFCAAFPAVVYLLRTLGPHPAWAAFDAGTRAVFTSYACALPDDVWALACLPRRLGGLGLRSAATHAGVAHQAFLEDSATSSRPLLLCRRADGQGPAPQPAHANQRPASRQKALSTELDSQTRAALLARMDTAGHARVMSCSAPGASAWLAHATPTHQSWLPGPAFLAAIRLRFGLPVLPFPGPCGLCGHARADVFGVHTLSCMSGGQRTLMHHGLVNELHGIASAALLHSTREAAPFGNGLRLDYLLRAAPVHGSVGADVAIVNPLGPAHVGVAALAPGAAATAYEATKVLKYGALCAAAHIHFVPVVADIFGAFGEAARPHIAMIAGAWSRQAGVSGAAASLFVAHRLSVAVAKAVGNALVRQEGLCRASVQAMRAPAELAADRL